ncbi:hypothetical protein BUY46_01030, partial [Staphylococcus devriesei]
MHNILLVGFNIRVITQLEISKKDISLYIIEEKEIYTNNFSTFNSPIIEKIIFGAYQQSNEALSLIKKLSMDIAFSAVISGREYAVSLTNKIAKYLKLPRIGDLAANCFTNKYILRQNCNNIGIPQPKYQKINNILEVKSQNILSFPKILKPSNRQSSVGVVLINKEEECETAWNITTSAKEEGVLVSKRNFTWEYQAEELLIGNEVSVEVLISNSNIVFENITQKHTTQTEYFVELGHTVPATNIEEDIKYKLHTLTNKLVKGLDVKYGVLHVEWMITEDGPYLIECAGRAPGDNITELISYSYNINFFEKLLEVLIGEYNQDLKLEPYYITGIKYFDPPIGVFKGVQGLNKLGQYKEIIKYELHLKENERIKKLDSSWNRIGYY